MVTFGLHYSLTKRKSIKKSLPCIEFTLLHFYPFLSTTMLMYRTEHKHVKITKSFKIIIIRTGEQSFANGLEMKG